MKSPPSVALATKLLNNAVLKEPRCRYPVGDGAKRVRIGLSADCPRIYRWFVSPPLTLVSLLPTFWSRFFRAANLDGFLMDRSCFPPCSLSSSEGLWEAFFAISEFWSCWRPTELVKLRRTRRGIGWYKTRYCIRFLERLVGWLNKGLILKMCLSWQANKRVWVSKPVSWDCEIVVVHARVSAPHYGGLSRLMEARACDKSQNLLSVDMRPWSLNRVVKQWRGRY